MTEVSPVDAVVLGFCAALIFWGFDTPWQVIVGASVATTIVSQNLRYWLVGWLQIENYWVERCQIDAQEKKP